MSPIGTMIPQPRVVIQAIVYDGSPRKKGAYVRSKSVTIRVPWLPTKKAMASLSKKLELVALEWHAEQTETISLVV